MVLCRRHFVPNPVLFSRTVFTPKCKPLRIHTRYDDPTEVNQHVFSARYIDSPIVWLHDSNGDGDLEDVGDLVRYYLSDANHNTTAVFDSSTGAVVNYYVYTAYGTATKYDSSWANPTAPSADGFLYCGYWLDFETGDYQVRAREYITCLSTFDTRDPIESDLNLYRYVWNNPLVYTDPTGEKVYWCARDVDNAAGTGNHHHIVVVPDNPGDFPGQLIDFFGGEQGFTLAGFEDENGCLVYEKNKPADIAATREFNDPDRYSECPDSDKYKSGWSQECHEVSPPNGMSDTEFINKLLEGANNYAQNTKGKCVKFNVRVGPNCASWANSLLAYAGVGVSDRNTLGEFSGTDWGEEVIIGGNLFDPPTITYEPVRPTWPKPQPGPFSPHYPYHPAKPFPPKPLNPYDYY